jgi:penicillin G amidase
MKFIKLIISVLFFSGWIYLLNTSFGMTPPIGKFLNPFTGFWQNAEATNYSLAEKMQLNGLKDFVNVHIDERRVPHVFANNEHDLYFMQGYLTARDRLWQMEFISYASSGRLSELVGEKTFEMDRVQRRMGIPWSAANAIAHLNEDSVLKNVMLSYAEGVNAYISSLNERTLPLEYKLLNYKPQTWEPYQSALLLKYMAKMLASQETDFELTNALKMFGKETVDILYPDFPQGIDPIHPVGTVFNFPKDTFPQPVPFVPDFLMASNIHEKPQYEHLGSNNWAVHGSKTKSGKPILCNDPHLQLQLPSIWYEIQLHAPGVNTYGVSIPGSPCVTIGFNEKVAWGVTNAGMDVKDWYAVQFKDAERDSYLFDGKYLPTKKIIEAIHIKGKDIYYDTVVYTHHGPVMYDGDFHNGNYKQSFAMRWTAHESYQELKTFYLLNRANNYNDYYEAINYFQCPAQNFVFASQSGDVAICETGLLPLKYEEQGKYLLDGSLSAYEWRGYIPRNEIPVTKNPERGFVSSANQHFTDSTYPHYYNTGYGYEYYRNRRINMRIAALQYIAPEDMMKLQNDNFNLHAKEILTFLLLEIESSKLSPKESEVYNELLQWNHFNEADMKAPTYFSAFWDTLYLLTWDELSNGTSGNNYLFKKPNFYVTVDFLINHQNHPFIDIKATPEKETFKQLVNIAFKASVAKLSETEKLNWTDYKNTVVGHYARIAPFDVPVKVGGYKYAVNAISQQHGPSWRMVVSLEEPVKAWGTYPGGQSGNPGSANFNMQIEKWAKGEYYELQFLKNADDTQGIKMSQTFTP